MLYFTVKVKKCIQVIQLSQTMITNCVKIYIHASYVMALLTDTSIHARVAIES